jgi:hypothetical protein
MSDQNTPINTESSEENRQVKPDDSSGMYVRGFLKISDPESGETIVETGN